jgi:tetratricopeptide (TPR) repeat protein
MKKIFAFLTKHNQKITIILILAPILFQFRDFVSGPIQKLFQQIPTKAELYDAVAGFRSPFSDPEKTSYDKMIDQILVQYQGKYPAYAISNLRFSIQSLLRLQYQKNISSAEKNKIDEALINLKYRKTGLAQAVIKQRIKKEKDKQRQANLSLYLASFKYFDSKGSALKIYKKILIIDPGNIFALNATANLYTEMRRWKKAIAANNNIIQYARTNNKQIILSAALANLGVIYQKQKHYHLAEKYYSEALQINTNLNRRKEMAAQYVNLAILYERQKKITEACMNYRKAKIIFHKDFHDDLALTIERKITHLRCRH